MKKTMIVLVVTGIFAISAGAQTNSFELGIRLGYVASIDMVFPANAARVHSSAGWGIDYFLFDTFYDFQVPVKDERWFFYAGPGVGLRYWDQTRSDQKGVGLAILGEIGIEHRFNKPVSLGLDWAPFFDLVKT